jgi:hypothetical protein
VSKKFVFQGEIDAFDDIAASTLSTVRRATIGRTARQHQDRSDSRLQCSALVGSRSRFWAVSDIAPDELNEFGSNDGCCTAPLPDRPDQSMPLLLPA